MGIPCLSQSLKAAFPAPRRRNPPPETSHPFPLPTYSSTPSSAVHTTITRRILLSSFLIPAYIAQTSPVLAKNIQVSNKLRQAYTEALLAGESGDLDKADELWTAAIYLDHVNPSTWSNRGSIRLQLRHWADAESDFQEAARLEELQYGRPTGLVLNDLGNAKGALGNWEGAIACYKDAAEQEPELYEIASANLALALFQVCASAADTNAQAGAGVVL